MKPLRQQVREAVAVAGCTIVWATFALVSFDRMPDAWFRSTGAYFAPVTGPDVAFWFLPMALVVLFVAGWMATLGLIFRVFQWHIRDDDAGPEDRDDPLGRSQSTDDVHAGLEQDRPR
jgi:hypothetical protein